MLCGYILLYNILLYYVVLYSRVYLYMRLYYIFIYIMYVIYNAGWLGYCGLWVMLLSMPTKECSVFNCFEVLS